MKMIGRIWGAQSTFFRKFEQGSALFCPNSFFFIFCHQGAIVYLGYGFLFVINTRHGPNMQRLPAKGYWKLHDLEMTFQGHHRSYLMAPLYTFGYGFLFVINSRHEPNMHRLPAKSYWKLHDLEMIFQCHHRSYLLMPLYTLGMVSYLSLTVAMGLTCTICLQKAIELHDLEMTFQCHHRSYLLTPLYTLGGISYLSFMKMTVLFLSGMVSMCLTGTICLQKAIESCMTLKGHHRS